MKVYRNIEEFLPVKNAVATTGTFDGVHIGHQAIISRVKQIALESRSESVVITFYPHPQIVLHPEEKNILILNTDEEKINLLSKYEIDHLIIIPFTLEFASFTYTDFIKNILIDRLHISKLVIGYDHHFGKDRKGELQHLIDYGRQYNFEVEEIPAQKMEDVAVSSTKIRKALLNGDIRTANKFLGYNYFFNGKVVKGDGIGKTLGFPTANIEVEDSHKLIPAQGVYVVEVEYKNKRYGGMMSIGTRPTIDGNKQVIEVNIFNFASHINFEFLTVYLIERFREQIKFPGLEQLKEQLIKDKEYAESVLSKFLK